MEKLYKILKVLIVILLAAVVTAGAVTLYHRSQPETTLESQQLDPEKGNETEPSAAPDFTVYDADGNACKLSDFRGKPVVLNFWASWCGPCKSEMPDLEEAYGEYGGEIQFLIVNLTDGFQETVTTASEYIAGQGYTFPVYYDTDMDAASAYEISVIPMTYFLDAEGNLVYTVRGMMSAEVLQGGIDMLLNGK